MSGLDGLTREEILRIHIEEAFHSSPTMSVTLMSRDTFDRIVKGRPGFYYDHGIIPFTVDATNHVTVAAFCPDIILAETEGWDEQPFLAYVVYWTLRLKIRITKQAELVSISGDADGDLLEEMVESEMVASGLDRWWESRLRGRA